MLPVSAGVIPFGAVMGSVAAEAGLSFSQSFWMNILVFAGAAQIAAVDLMSQDAPSSVVIVTGLIINLRFILYSAALSPVVQRSSFLTKLVCSYFLTDQSYAVMSAEMSKFKNNFEAVRFYLGSCICMGLMWHLSVAAGFVFGNFAPASLNLDYAVPMSFIALLIPTLKNARYVLVAVFSAVCSLLTFRLPDRVGLILTALLAMGVAAVLSQTGRQKKAKT